MAFKPLLRLHQLFFVFLQRRDVGADGDEAAVLGPALRNLQPAAVFELRLIGSFRRTAALAHRDGLRRNFRVGGRSHHVLVGRAGLDHGIRQAVQRLVVGIADDQFVFRIPQNEGFRDGFDRVAKAQVRHAALLGKFGAVR